MVNIILTIIISVYVIGSILVCVSGIIDNRVFPADERVGWDQIILWTFFWPIGLVLIFFEWLMSGRTK